MGNRTYKEPQRECERELAQLKVTCRRYSLDQETATYLKEEIKALEELLA